MVQRALVSGVTGQDGSYLIELLLQKGYEVHGLIRRASTFNTERIDHVYQEPHDPNRRLFLHYSDLSDGTGLRHVLELAKPQEVYNLAAQSHVKVSFEQPEYTADVTGLGVLRLLEAVRDVQQRTGDAIKFYQASSSEMFGKSVPPQSLETPFHPRSPYACAKVFAYWQTVNYREAYDLFAVNGILFNHESERRGETFVTRKITRAVGRIACGLQDRLYLGNLDAIRDWGHARDYAVAMYLMLQQPVPRDYVVATGEAHSVREFAELAFAHVGLDYRKYVVHDPRYLRPAEVEALRGDASATYAQLGWRPQTSFHELIVGMVEHDLELARQERTLRQAGHQVSTRGAGHG
jgi:GDPmannose 4,6-dehydratase